MAVDHCQASSHVAREVECGDSGTKREGREGVAEIVDAAERVDAGATLGGSPLIGPEPTAVDGVNARRYASRCSAAIASGSLGHVAKT